MFKRLMMFLGYKQYWHISCIMYKEGRIIGYGETTITANPWICVGSMENIWQKVAEEMSATTGVEITSKHIVIINMARIHK